jgi:hypothetical protein
MADGAQGPATDGSPEPGDDRAKSAGEHGGPGGEGSGDSGPAGDSDGGTGGEGSGHSEPADDPADHGAYAHATPEQLLGQARTVRRQARRARHAYWFPLVLFGLLTCASVPFYVPTFPPADGIFLSRNLGPQFLRSEYLGGFGFVTGVGTAYYWLAAILVGLVATAVWYRVHGNRVGLRTPSRGFVITGLVLLVLALLIPLLATRGGAGPLTILMPGDLLVRGTFPFVLIGIGLCVLAWAERSIALTVIAAGYLALALVASLYDIENVFYDLGWNLSPAASRLPNVVLPALVLLLSGAGAWVVQRRRRPRPAGPPDAAPAPATAQPS